VDQLTQDQTQQGKNIHLHLLIRPNMAQNTMQSMNWQKSNEHTTLTASPRRTVFCGILLTAFLAAVVNRFCNIQITVINDFYQLQFMSLLN